MAKNIALVVTGSVASIRTIGDGENPGLVEELQSNGFNVTVIATDSAKNYKFVDAVKVEQISGNPVYSATKFENAFGNADIIMVSPSAAGFISQIANQTTEIGEALASSDKPRVISPAMNLWMWSHPATQRNIRQLANSGWNIAGPVWGDLACGECGYGRMLDVRKIAQAVTELSTGGASDIFNLYKQALIPNARLPQAYSKEATTDKKILFVIQGGRDAESVPEVIEALVKKGCNVTCAISEEVRQIISTERLTRVSGNIVYQAHYQKDEKEGMEHINLSRNADMVLIAPMTERFAGEMAIGGATSFVSDIYLATNKPVVAIPSLDPNARPTALNIERVKQDGATIIARTNSTDIANQVCALLENQKQL